MRSLFLKMVLLSGVLLVGCSQGSPGGPGVTGPSPSFGQAENTFNLSVPRMATTVQQGESFEASIGIQRGVNFDQDVALIFSNLPVGISIQPAEPKILRGANETKVKFIAESAATAGSFQAKLTGHPTKGGDAQVDFSLSVVVKDSFTFKLPTRVELKQGTDTTVPVEIVRAGKFVSDVSLTFTDFPSGVSIEPITSVIKSTDAATRFQLTATKEAAVGQFNITITGTPVDGTKVEHVWKLEVQIAE
ncbi:MAG: hypothetical protein Q8M16_22650 [Pirellulaceae bacterium]|nr:hypothetical protein [Pirellulaceae bacterium]